MKQEDVTVLPRSIATKAAFENAMTLDIAMGGSTNTVLHILAAAHEGGVDFTMDDIDALSRRVAQGSVPVEGRAGPGRRAHGRRAPCRRHHGDPRRARPRRACSMPTLPTVHETTLGDALSKWDIAVTDHPARQ